MPFIVLHGEDDKVTDKNVSKLLYEVASSSDKTFKLYPNMWHGLLYGESPENLEIVFSDIISWLKERASVTNQKLETELKHVDDGFSMQKWVFNLHVNYNDGFYVLLLDRRML